MTGLEISEPSEFSEFSEFSENYSSAGTSLL